MNELALAALIGMAMISAYVMRLLLSILIEADDVPGKTLDMADRLGIPRRERPVTHELPAYPQLWEEREPEERPVTPRIGRGMMYAIEEPPRLGTTTIRMERPKPLTPGTVRK